MPPPAPTLPPCDLRSGSIQAIYAGRFAIIAWADFCQTAQTAFGDGWSERVAALRQASGGTVSAAERGPIQESYECLMSSASGRLQEEVAHHALLSRQPMWGFLNGIALAERLHLNHLEILLARPARATWAHRRALAHALRCHIARRAVYRELFPVIEAMHVIDAATVARRPRLLLGRFGTAYGATAEALAVAGFDRIRAGTASRDEVEETLASVLTPSAIAADPWQLIEIGPRAFRSEAGRLAAAARQRLDAKDPEPRRDRRWSLASFFTWYLPRGNGGLVPGLVRWPLVRAYASALLPLLGGLLKDRPYEAHGTNFPALWTEAPDGRGAILDPAALAHGGGTLAHPGLENTNPLLPRGALEGGYAIDQYIVRRVVERCADPTDHWSPRLRNFLLRWTHIAADEQRRARVESILASIEAEVGGLAQALSTRRGDVRLAHGEIDEDAWSLFVSARTRLIDASMAEEGHAALSKILGAYYIHGL